MPKTQKTAILLGATGLVGEQLLKRLLLDDNYTCIKLFSRNPTSIKHPKIKEYLGNVIELEKFTEDFTADEVFCCIGTTAAKTKDKQLYKAIDIGIPTQAAKLSKANGIEFFAVISAMGANSKSRVFYNRVKGEMEQAVLAENIKHTYIVRPSLLYGKRGETRWAEDIGNGLLKKIRPLMLGKLRQYQPIAASQVALSMHWLASARPNKTYLDSGQMQLIDATNITR